jgi:hypothetical protein
MLLPVAPWPKPTAPPAFDAIELPFAPCPSAKNPAMWLSRSTLPFASKAVMIFCALLLKMILLLDPLRTEMVYWTKLLCTIFPSLCTTMSPDVPPVATLSATTLPVPMTTVRDIAGTVLLLT